MKYLVLLLLSISINAFAQNEKQIFLETHPEEKYVISYSTGECTFYFGYQDFLNQMDNSVTTELFTSVKALIDSRLASQSTLELVTGVMVQKGEDQFDLKELAERNVIYYLLSKGNYILLDASGKPTVQQLTRTYFPENSAYVFTDAATGKEMYRCLKRFRTIGTPSF